MDQALELRLYIWHIRRRYLRVPVVAVATLALVGLIVQHNWARITQGVDEVHSSCMPYQLSLPTTWHVRLISANRCGYPILNEDYLAQVGGEQITISVDAVQMNGGLPPQELGFSRGDVSMRSGKLGQQYILVMEGSDTQYASHATFIAEGLSFVVSVRGFNTEVLLQTLLRTMDGWQTVHSAAVSRYIEPLPSPQVR